MCWEQILGAVIKEKCKIKSAFSSCKSNRSTVVPCICYMSHVGRVLLNVDITCVLSHCFDTIKYV